METLTNKVAICVAIWSKLGSLQISFLVRPSYSALKLTVMFSQTTLWYNAAQEAHCPSMHRRRSQIQPHHIHAHSSSSPNHSLLLMKHSAGSKFITMAVTFSAMNMYWHRCVIYSSYGHCCPIDAVAVVVL